MGTDNLHYLRLHILHLLLFRRIGEILAAQIAGQDDQRVAEIHGATLSVCQAPIIKDLQQDVDHVAVRLFHFVDKISEERREGNECVSTGSILCASYMYKKTTQTK